MNQLINQLLDRSTRLIALLGLLVLCSDALAATIDQEKTTELKGVWVARLTGYTDWPTLAESTRSATSTITIGVLGSDPNGVIDVIRQRMAAPGGLFPNGRRLQLMDLNASFDLSDLTEQLQACDVLFLSEDAFSRWSALQPLVEAQPILTVGESDGFAERGGVVEFYPDPIADLLIMRINLQAMRRSGVAVSATILSLSNVEILETVEEAR